MDEGIAIHSDISGVKSVWGNQTKKLDKTKILDYKNDLVAKGKPESVQRRHLDILTNRLEHVMNAGCVHILWSELYRWYEVQKIAARTYRDIGERWQEVSECRKGQLRMIEGAGGVYLFAEGAIKAVPN